MTKANSKLNVNMKSFNLFGSRAPSDVPRALCFLSGLLPPNDGNFAGKWGQRGNMLCVIKKVISQATCVWTFLPEPPAPQMDPMKGQGRELRLIWLNPAWPFLEIIVPFRVMAAIAMESFGNVSSVLECYLTPHPPPPPPRPPPPTPLRAAEAEGGQRGGWEEVVRGERLFVLLGVSCRVGARGDRVWISLGV